MTGKVEGGHGECGGGAPGLSNGDGRDYDFPRIAIVAAAAALAAGSTRRGPTTYRRAGVQQIRDVSYSDRRVGTPAHPIGPTRSSTTSRIDPLIHPRHPRRLFLTCRGEALCFDGDKTKISWEMRATTPASDDRRGTQPAHPQWYGRAESFASMSISPHPAHRQLEARRGLTRLSSFKGRGREGGRQPAVA